jgi:tetratricopeptide (TPR) repeat protein
MATTVTATGTPATGAAPSFFERAVAWAAAHRQATTYAGVVLVLAAGLFWWNRLSTRRSESIARDELLQARAAFEAKNYPFAASELSKIAENYSGTMAASEATLLLGQARLLQGQAQQAVGVLVAFAPGAHRAYRAQTYGLLGAAYENLGRSAEAAGAYMNGAAAAELGFMEAQLLSDAARAYVAAGDTAKALEAYGRIVATLGETPSAPEARVRIGELTKGAGVP